MIKRIVSLLAAVMVTASSAFAWDAYSFTGVVDRDLGVSPFSDSSNLFDGYDFLKLLSDPTSKMWALVNVFHPSEDVAGILVPSYREVRPVPLDGVVSAGAADIQPWGVFYQSYTDPFYFNSDLNGGEFDGVVAIVNSLDRVSSNSYDSSFFLDLNLSSLPSFNSFSLSGGLFPYFNLASSSFDSETSPLYCSRLGLIVNGSLVHTFYPDSQYVFNFSDFVYTSVSPITSIRFSFLPVGGFSFPVDWIFGRTRFVVFDRNVSFSILGDNSALDGHVGNAQGNLNDLDGIESQWAGAMSENFGKLDLGNFTFPSGLVSGFALMSGIFQDLWNSMGEYKILYVFPLFLGIALLLIGRISKFSGGQSSTTKNRGDSDA